MTNFVKKLYIYLQQLRQQSSYTPSYRVLDFLQDDENNYTAHIQVINKNITFYSNPEDILADDKLVSMFSPTDVRTLTYLGYLGINAPKYKILAQRMIDNQKTVFIIKKSGDKNMIIKTASEILKEHDIITSMQPEDARKIGYTVAIENIQDEKDLKQNLLEKASRQKPNF